VPKLCRGNADPWRKATDGRLSPVLDRALSRKPAQPALGTNNVIPQVRISITQNDKYLSQKSRFQGEGKAKDDEVSQLLWRDLKYCRIGGLHSEGWTPAQEKRSPTSFSLRFQSLQPKRPGNAKEMHSF
jgi:hypothetical protein